MKERPIVLLVDDDPSTVHVLPTHLAELAGVEVRTAHDGREAAEVLQRAGVDLVVTRLELPIVDGLTLLAHVHNRHPGLGVVVLTRGHGGPPTERRHVRFGSVSVLRTPCSAATVAAAVRAELDRIDLGHVHGVTLASLAQVIEVVGVSGVIDVTAGDRRARLHFARGVLTDADTDAGTHGEAAAAEILGWPVGRVDVRRVEVTTARRISTPLHDLLVAAALIDDADASRSTGERPPSPSPPAPARSGHAHAASASGPPGSGGGAATVTTAPAAVAVATTPSTTAPSTTSTRSDGAPTAPHDGAPLPKPSSGRATVVELEAAIARLHERLREAEQALLGIARELEGLQEARTRLEHEEARRERQRREFERFRDDVTAMARSTIERVERLFVEEHVDRRGNGRGQRRSDGGGQVR